MNSSCTVPVIRVLPFATSRATGSVIAQLITRSAASADGTNVFPANKPVFVNSDSVTMRQAGWIGAVQGLCLPFRGFSRSGATISTGMLTGASKQRAERFSFALAVVLTPPVVGREVLRLVKASHEATAAGTAIDLHGSMVTGVLGAFFAFLAGLVALKWLSSWLEEGRWYLFGIYCLVASVVVFGLYRAGY